MVGLTHDVLEMRVARPPADREGALDLARQHYLYCPDLVDQGTPTLDGLGAALLGSPVWSFWWD